MGSPATERIINQSLKNSACTDYSSKLFDPMIQSLQNSEQLASPLDFAKEVQKQNLGEAYNTNLVNVYKEIYELVQDDLSKSDYGSAIQKISELETNDPKYRNQKIKIQSLSKQVTFEALNLNLNCESQPAEINNAEPIFESIKKLAHPAVYGAHKVTATSYQSCETLDQLPIDKNTKNLEGIKITGVHENGVGQKREIASLQEVISSHYYIDGVSAAQASCENLKLNPLIYDYGGKPYASAGVNGTLNVFKDSGTGTAVLGIDCSGYVFAAFASAGLKMNPQDPLKAQNVYGINSARFKSAPDSGLTCFEYAKVSSSYSLKAGDVVASGGHVFLVDWIGTDPLGIAAINNVADCRLGPISATKFDFVLSQSAPVKNGLGINRMFAKDYLGGGLSGNDMKSGMEQFAIQACIAKFNNQTLKPSLIDIGVIRHKRTPECLANEVYLDQQDCLNVCRL